MVRSGESRWFSHWYYIYIICHFPVCLTLCFELLPLAETLSVLHIFDHPGQPVPTKKPISSFTQRSAWDELIFTAWWWLEPWNLMTCHSVGNFIIPTDFHIFQRGRYTTNQTKTLDFLERINKPPIKLTKKNWTMLITGGLFFFSRQQLGTGLYLCVNPDWNTCEC